MQSTHNKTTVVPHPSASNQPFAYLPPSTQEFSDVDIKPSERKLEGNQSTINYFEKQLSDMTVSATHFLEDVGSRINEEAANTDTFDFV
ncbi:hypothetical protein ABK040_010419 [Willaertia magna]